MDDHTVHGGARKREIDKKKEDTNKGPFGNTVEAKGGRRAVVVVGGGRG